MKILYFNTVFLALTLLASCSSTKTLSEAQIKDEKSSIMTVMKDQENAWNRGDIDAFMEGYWKSDRLSFTGSKGISYGWNQVLANYKKNYPDKATMGKLQFDVDELNPISTDAFHMIGKYTLYRENDKPTGYFTLIWKKVDGKWVITSDHTG